MTDPLIAELSAAHDRNETLARIIERRLGGEYARTLGIEPPRREGDDPLSDARYRAEFSARRLAWLEGRLDETNRRAQAHAESHRARARGVSRFIPDGLTLDDLISTALDTPQAFRELQEQRVARLKQEHKEEDERVEREQLAKVRS